MFSESQNFAIVQTELDFVYFQTLAYDGTSPGIATAQTGSIFKPIATEHAAYIGEVSKETGLYSIIGETQTVPVATPHVTNKFTINIADFANSIRQIWSSIKRMNSGNLLLALDNPDPSRLGIDGRSND